MDHVPMNLVLFDDAIEHLTRVHRVIRMEKGHALLVGVGGSGKQSLTKLGAFSAGCEVFEITLTRGYDENSFREDLKGLYSKLGLENKKMVFLFTDAHVAQEGKIPKRYWHINTINNTKIKMAMICIALMFYCIPRLPRAHQQHAHVRNGSCAIPR